jgi:hypothetical protein
MQGNLLIDPPQLSGSRTSSYLVAKWEELSEGNDEFVLRKYLCSSFEGIFDML